MAHAEAGWNRDAEVLNLGLGGAQVGVSEALAVGDRVTMSFAAPSRWDPLEVRGRVVWVRAGAGLEPTRAGIAFDVPNESVALALFQLIGWSLDSGS
jgi:hypothetical protein